jgi:hypothetical protein
VMSVFGGGGERVRPAHASIATSVPEKNQRIKASFSCMPVRI